MTQVRRAAVPAQQHAAGREVRVARQRVDQGRRRRAEGGHHAGRQVHHLHHRRPARLLRRLELVVRARLGHRAAAGGEGGRHHDHRARRPDARCSICAPGILQAFANAGAGEPTVAPLRAGARHVRLLRPVQRRRRLARRPGRAGQAERARRRRWDLRGRPRADPSLHAERRRSDPARVAAVGRALGRQELHVRSQRRRRQGRSRSTARSSTRRRSRSMGTTVPLDPAAPTAGT